MNCPGPRFMLGAVVLVYLAGLAAKLIQPDLDLGHLGEDAVITGIFALLRTEVKPNA